MPPVALTLTCPVPPNAQPLTLCTPEGRPIGEWDFSPGDALDCFVMLRTSPRGVIASVVLTRDASLRCGARLTVARKGSVLLPMHAPALGARDGLYLSRAARVAVTRDPRGARVLSAVDRGACPLAPAALALARKADELRAAPAENDRRLAVEVGDLTRRMLGPFALLMALDPEGPARAA